MNLSIPRTLLLCILSMGSQLAAGQKQHFVLSQDKLSYLGRIPLDSLPGWKYHQGHDSAWINPEYDVSGWKTLQSLDQISQQTNENGLIKGCLRFSFTTDSSLKAENLNIRVVTTSLVKVYINGKEVSLTTHAFGRDMLYLPRAFSFYQDRTNVITVFLTEYRSPWLDQNTLVNLSLPPVWVRIGNDSYRQLHTNWIIGQVAKNYFWLTALVLLMTLFWLLFWQNPSDKALFWIALNTSFLLAYQFFGYFSLDVITTLRNIVPGWSRTISQLLYELPGGCWLGTIPLVISQLLSGKIKPAHRVIWSAGIMMVVGYLFFSRLPWVAASKLYINCAYSLFLFIYILNTVITYRKQLTKAQWAVFIGLLLTVTGAVGVGYMWIINYNPGYSSYLLDLMASIAILSFPLSLLIYTALRFQENMATIQNKAQEVITLSQEKEQILSYQNELLEQQVEARTAELKASQTQLIQKEKMASLGELTAGIAHEIQNPLNFVNNFAEVSVEMADELQQSAKKGDLTAVTDLSAGLKENMGYIAENGQRAAGIVRSMLEHSRTTPGERRPTDLNELADEYLRLAYLGMRAKDPDFQVQLHTDFDSDLPLIEIAPQEIGRVLLNLYNNAFYAVREKHARQVVLAGIADADTYQPTVWVSTTKLPLLKGEGWGDRRYGEVVSEVIIKVRDNGMGVPEEIVSKIFQPFFTTKPTGQGTGLGLSLSYDIVTKGHGGEMRVESREGEGSVFVVQLPITHG